MSDTPQLLLVHHLKALKLPTFLREYDKLAQQCAAEGLDHPRYLLRLAELELIERERRMIERRIKEARFPTVKASTVSTSRRSLRSTRHWSWSSLAASTLLAERT
jgi:DNA replication protein DnaC